MRRELRLVLQRQVTFENIFLDCFEKNVLRLDISVQDPGLVKMLDGLHQVLEQKQTLGKVEVRLVVCELLAQIPVLAEVVDLIHVVGGSEVPKMLDDVGRFHSGEGLNLLGNHSLDLGVLVVQRGLEDFDSDQLPGRYVLSLVYLGELASSDLLKDQIVVHYFVHRKLNLNFGSNQVCFTLTER